VKKFKDFKLSDQFDIKNDMKMLKTPAGTPTPMDLRSQHRLYGKVDRLNSPVRLLVADAGSLATLRGTRGLMAVNFVARAFRDLQREYLAMIGKRALQPLMGIENLDPVRGWSDFGEFYNSHIKALSSLMHVMCSTKYNRSIRNFGDFVRVYFQIIKEVTSVKFVTKSGLLMSDVTPNRVSGLVIELMPHSKSDEEKKLLMMTHPAFRSFAHLCARHGFRLDQDAPWTLIANLNSSKMNEYAKVSGVSLLRGGGNFFERFYTKTHLEDLDSLRSLLPTLYNQFVAHRPMLKIEKYSDDGKLQKLTYYRQPLANPSDGYDLRFWMEVLFKTRLSETTLVSEVTQEVFDEIIDKCLEIEDKYGLEISLNHMNQAIKNLNYDLNLLARKVKNLLTPKKMHHIMLTIHKK
tara:strand:+ start:429 stop:1646 length:1218 start_codon:yes stop_codon:yes gene_type:complete